MRAILYVCLVAFLAACGFHLRGEAKLPFNTLYVAGAANSPIVDDLRRQVQAASSTRLVDKPEGAQASLQVLGEAREKIILSLTGAGKVREFQLRQRVTFRVADAKNQDLIPTSEIVLYRMVSFSDSEVLAKQAEETLLYRDMEADAVQQIMRRLAAIKPST